jgi:ClpP class serine protease
MNLLDFLTSPWAILPEKLIEMQAIYATHLRGDKIDLEAVEARLGRTLANEQRAYEVADGGVGVLQVMGVMSPRANMLMQISGGVSTQMLTRQVESMRDDARVRSALFVADTPGGHVQGVPALTKAMRELAAVKPTVTVVEGKLASAGYWALSACNALFIEGETELIGSLGVVARLGWDPKSDNSMTLYRGKYKVASANGERPSADIIAHAEQQIDYLYQVLVGAVAENRGVGIKEVIEHMADGRVFTGQQAIDAGLVDGVSTADAMVDRLAANPDEFAQRRKAVFALGGLPEAHEDEPVSPVANASNPTSEEGTVMPQADNNTVITRESLERDHAALFAQLRSDFMTAGASAERDRIAAVRAQSLPGHEALVESLAMDGRTTGPEAAAAVLAAHRVMLNAAAAAHANDAPNPVPTDAGAGDDKPVSKQAQADEATKYAAEKGVSFVAAMKALGFAS